MEPYSDTQRIPKPRFTNDLFGNDAVIHESILRVNDTAIRSLMQKRQPISAINFFKICKVFPALIPDMCVNYPGIAGECVRNVKAKDFDGIESILRALLRERVVLNIAEGDDGLTLFHRACQSGKVEVIVILLEMLKQLEDTELLVGSVRNVLTKPSMHEGMLPLHFAIRGKHKKVIELLLPLLQLATYKDVDGSTALHHAVKVQDMDLINTLSTINQGELLELENDEKETPLLTAAQEGHVEVVEFLASKGADFARRSSQVGSFLHYAAIGGSCALLDMALGKGFPLDDKNEHGETALFLAAKYGRTDAVRYLLAKGADHTLYTSHLGKFLHYAACGGNPEIVTLALNDELGCVVDEVNDRDETALHIAAKCGHLQAVHQLLSAGADTDVQDESQQTFLHKAAYGGNVVIISLAIEKGCDIRAKDDYEETPLFKAALQGNVEAAKTLIAAGSDVNEVNYNGENFLHAAVHGGSIPLLHLALEKGCSIESKNSEGSTAIFLAAEEGHLPVITALIEKGADVNVRDADGNSLLHYAVIQTWPILILRLRQLGCDMNAKNRAGKTPLLIAFEKRVKRERWEDSMTIYQLLIAGADVYAEANNGQSPFIIAAENAHTGDGVSKWLFNDIVMRLSVNDIPKLYSQLLKVDPSIKKIVLDHTIRDGGQTQHLTENHTGEQVTNSADNRVGTLLLKYLRDITPTFMHKILDGCGSVYDLPEYIRSNPNHVQQLCTCTETPLELAYISPDPEMTAAVFEQLSREQREQGIRILLEKYPEKMGDILNKFFVIDVDHLTLGNIRSLSFPAQNGDELQPPRDLLAFFANDAVKRRYEERPLSIDGVSLSYDVLKERVGLFVDRVANEVHFNGTPPAGTESLRYYYNRIKNAISGLIVKARQQEGDLTTDMLVTIYKELAYTSGYCGAPYLQTSLSLYKRFCAGVPDTFENKLYEGLQKKRDLVVDAMSQNESYVIPLQSVHSIAFIKRQLGYLFQLSDAQVFEKAIDNWASLGFQNGVFPSQEKLEESFNRHYTPSEVHAWVMDLCNDQDFRDKYTEWAKKELKNKLVDQQEYKKRKKDLKTLEEKFLKIHYKAGVTQEEIESVKREIEACAGSEYAPSQYWTPSFSLKSEFEGKISAALQDLDTLKVKPIGVVWMLQKLGVLTYPA